MKFETNDYIEYALYCLVKESTLEHATRCVLFLSSIHSGVKHNLLQGTNILFFMEYSSAIDLTKERRIALPREITHGCISRPCDVIKMAVSLHLNSVENSLF